MMEAIVNSTIEILGKIYPIRCKESEVASLHEAAVYLDQQMKQVKDSGKVINLERIAIITALNIAHQFLALEHENNEVMGNINHRIASLHEKISLAMSPSIQEELLCINDQKKSAI